MQLGQFAVSLNQFGLVALFIFGDWFPAGLASVSFGGPVFVPSRSLFSLSGRGIVSPVPVRPYLRLLPRDRPPFFRALLLLLRPLPFVEAWLWFRR